MEYILDTANVSDIKYMNEYFPIAGVTTNPSIIAKEKTDFYGLVGSIRNIIGNEKMLHIQTTQKTAEKIVEEAEVLAKKVGGNLYIKIPVCDEGLKAASMLKRSGLNVGVTMTAIFTPQQALISAMAGADYVAPYVNRLDSISADGVGVVADIVTLFQNFDVKCKVLAASFKNVQQINDVALVGCHSVTANAELLKAAISHPMTDKAIQGFDADWQSVYSSSTMLDF